MSYLNELMSLQSLEQYINEGYISRRFHPYLPLAILNYTHKTTFERKWDGLTMMCRGLIYDTNNLQIIARPYPKFFNVGESDFGYDTEGIKDLCRQYGQPTILDKLDGSLGIGWTYHVRKPNDVWGSSTGYEVYFGVASRGSFESEQAQWATNWLKQRFAAEGVRGFSCSPGECVLFEIIYNQDRKIVPYNFEGLVTLGLRFADESEFNWGQVREWARSHKLRYVRRVRTPWSACVKEDRKDAEGYVLTWRTGHRYQRIKVKFPEYTRLAKLIGAFNPKDVWAMLVENKDFGPLMADTIPSHFRQWLIVWKEKLLAQFKDIEQRAETEFKAVSAEALLATRSMDEKDQRKWVAKQFLADGRKELSSILFSMLDEKDYAEQIWKMIKPKGDTPFIPELAEEIEQGVAA